MDALDVFKSEVFRPLATLVIPGSVAVGPYVVLTVHYNTTIATFWAEHPNYFTVMLGIVIVAAGFVLEDVGSRLESGVWDELIERSTGVQNVDWHSYLKLKYKKDEEPVGQHYLRTILIRFKFEMSFGFALIICWIGLLWLQLEFTPHPWRASSFAIYSCFHVITAIYLLRESYAGAWVLADIRHTLIGIELLAKVQQPAATAQLVLKVLLLINGIAGTVLGVILLISPFRQIFLSIPSSPTYEPLLRLIGALAAAFGVAILLLANVAVTLVRSTAWLMLLVHLLFVILLLLPHGQPALASFPIILLVGSAIFVIGYAWAGFRRPPQTP